MGVDCVNPNAPQFPCIICEKMVHTCEANSANSEDCCCPAHPDGVEVEAGWLCNEQCWVKYCLRGNHISSL
jgi:hypothetical protein